MNKRAHLTLGLGLALTLLACGDDADDKPAADGGTSGSGAGASGADAGKGGAGGTAGSKAGAGGGSSGKTEGDQCLAGDADCAEGLRCVTTAVGDIGVRICARPCSGAAGECGDEKCGSPYTDLVRDAHCINEEPTAFAYCGVGDTSICSEGRVCLYLPDSTIGVCVDPCNKDGSDEDAGIPTKVCETTQTCTDELVDDPILGACITRVGRGELCGLELDGKLCSSEDVCVPDDTENIETSMWHCKQDCSDTGTCAQGSCTRLSTTFAYCK